MELELITGACAPQKQIGNSDLDDLRGALDDHYADDSYDHWEMIMPGKMLVIMAGWSYVAMDNSWATLTNW